MRGSKRMNSSTRHKVDRKRKEAKRDIRKAAKAMKDAGMGNNRKKKAREAAKSALRMSKASANKEAVLNRLLQVREQQKKNKLERRAEAKLAREAEAEKSALDKEREAAIALAEHRRAKRNRDGEDEDEDEEEEFDDEDEEEEFDEEEEEEEMEDDAAPAEQKIREQRRLFIPTQSANKPHEQFRRFVDVAMFPHLDSDSVESLPFEAPNFALPSAVVLTVDARCAVQSTPWGELDYIMTMASEAQEEMMELEAALAHQKKQKDDAIKSAKKKGKKAPEFEDEGEGDMTMNRFVKPLILFALCKADTVAATTIAAQYKLLSDTLTMKYGYELPADEDSDEAAQKKKQSGERRLLKKSELPVEFAFAPFSHEIEGTTRQIMRVLRDYGNNFFQQVKDTYPDEKSALSHNLPGGKLAVLLHGLPKTGKSSLLRAMCTIGTDSAVAVCACNKMFIQAQQLNPKPDSEDQEPEIVTKLLIPSPKQLNVITLSDDQSFNRNAIISGDVVFYGPQTLEKIEVPETIATLLLSQMSDQEMVAQNFSCALSGTGMGGDDAAAPAKSAEKTAISTLKSLGRSIIRERGFLPSVYAGATEETTPGNFGTPSVLSASGVKDATFTAINGRRIVRVWPKKQDAKNALRVGARTFLKEFTTSQHFPWAVMTSADDSITLDTYKFDCIFTNKYFSKKDFGGEIPNSVAAEINGNEAQTTSAAQRSATFQAGLQAMQQAMMAYLILLPKISIPIDPLAIVPHQFDFFAGDEEQIQQDNAALLGEDDEADEEEDADFGDEDEEEEDEEMEGMEYLDDEAEEEEFDEDEEEGEWSDEE